VLCTNDETSFNDAREDEHSLCSLTDELRRRIVGIETAQGCLCALVNLGCAGSPARARQRSCGTES
jgi:hypothetical protein